ncbi:reca-superfamily ATPase possibly involved in signal transduction [Halogeometricum pallidum JCM 14848]|uniref:Reca-superfamily ATPase possibly involved in signal transduction n=1 Tax=Halogeometricum pallidum JCM 14848 TaxID=1227487 RepID=M0DIH5_HALPD|nr:RecA superfamily ATPase [Halogeometricum pallidum]ELZ34497.1 reca-superfamily ATPase possibly involved in signal transduction [Halogeometricum pallidum JCM 14848]
MSDRLTTGITVLDRELGGGIPAGSIVALLADPASQSELFLYELTAVRGTLYLTTVRSDQAVEDAIARTRTRTGSPTVRDVGGEAPLDVANKLVRDLPEGANLIVDIVDVLESNDPVRYRAFLNGLQTHMVNTGGLAVLHGMKGGEPANRRYTEHMADVVFDLRTTVDGAEIENRLAVPKFRGGRAPEETIKLRLSDQVAVDTSRDIA